MHVCTRMHVCIHLFCARIYVRMNVCMYTYAPADKNKEAYTHEHIDMLLCVCGSVFMHIRMYTDMYMRADWDFCAKDAAGAGPACSGLARKARQRIWPSPWPQPKSGAKDKTIHAELKKLPLGLLLEVARATAPSRWWTSLASFVNWGSFLWVSL